MPNTTFEIIDPSTSQPLTPEQRLRVLEISNRVLVEQIGEFTVAMRDVQACLVKGDSRMGQLETELQTNSQVTGEVRDILTTAKGAFRFFGLVGVVIKWVGGLATAAVALYTVIYMATHGGKPPGG